MSFVQDTRGQAYTFIIMAGTIILFAGFYAMMQMPAQTVLNESATRCVTDACQEGVINATNAWQWAPFAAAMLMLIMMIGSAVAKSRRP